MNTCIRSPIAIFFRGQAGKSCADALRCSSGRDDYHDDSSELVNIRGAIFGSRKSKWLVYEAARSKYPFIRSQEFSRWASTDFGKRDLFSLALQQRSVSTQQIIPTVIFALLSSHPQVESLPSARA
jgi:hypothetical protein